MTKEDEFRIWYAQKSGFKSKVTAKKGLRTVTRKFKHALKASNERYGLFPSKLETQMVRRQIAAGQRSPYEEVSYILGKPVIFMVLKGGKREYVDVPKRFLG